MTTLSNPLMVLLAFVGACGEWGCFTRAAAALADPRLVALQHPLPAKKYAVQFAFFCEA